MAGGKKGNQGPVLRNFRTVVKWTYREKEFLGQKHTIPMVQLSCGHETEAPEDRLKKRVWCPTCEREDTRP